MHVVGRLADGRSSEAIPVVGYEVVELNVGVADVADDAAQFDERLDVALNDRLANRSRVLAILAHVLHHLCG